MALTLKSLTWKLLIVLILRFHFFFHLVWAFLFARQSLEVELDCLSQDFYFCSGNAFCNEFMFVCFTEKLRKNELQQRKTNTGSFDEVWKNLLMDSYSPSSPHGTHVFQCWKSHRLCFGLCLYKFIQMWNFLPSVYV